MTTIQVPEGYAHKATSESFNGTAIVSVYYNRGNGMYLVVFDPEDEEARFCVTKTQLELILHAGKDVLDDQRV